MRLRPKSATSAAMGWARRLTVVLMLLWPAVLFAPAALAGGQTSVLITSPSSGEAAALYGSDTRYGALESLLGPARKGTTERPLSLDGSVGTRQVNVAWMALDLQSARVDRVFPGDDPDAVWIHTAVDVPATYRGHWHRAANPRELTALFEELGVMGEPDGAKAGTALFPRPWASEDPIAQDGARETEPARTAASPASAAPSGAPGTYEHLDTWWWVIPGLAVGAVLTLAAVRSRGARPEPRLRQELLDR